MSKLLGSSEAKQSPSFYYPKYPIECAGSSQYNNRAFYTACILVPFFFKRLLSLSWTSYLYLAAILYLPLWGLSLIYFSWYASYPLDQQFTAESLPISNFMEIIDDELKQKYPDTSKIPMEVFFESYFDGKINLKQDCLKTFEQRYSWASFGLTLNQIKFFLFQFIPEMIWHSRSQDQDQVRDHYDRGDDFYNAFLGETMIYTSGLVSDFDKKESLEQLQQNKLHDVCERLQLKPGDRHLDLGCGWGTLVNYAAKNYKSNSTGITLAVNQAKYATNKSKELGTLDNAKFVCMDYRDAPRRPRYNKISCLEMAEHVGIRKFSEFLDQIKDMLEDDGLFYLQIAGLRSAFQYEDLVWGLFMAKYVFPGADASCPLYWVINKLETAGFEIKSVNTVGIHYSATIGRWYENWMSNKDSITSKYGKRWFRVWEVFLAWSTIVARQGSSTCFQILAHKNLNAFDRAAVLTKPL
ncbi:hypothetical protein BB560_002220 [Smittium megazygosporum]|uniref:sphingolipid C(9)-methyltransferase n=1 Tax=Smittium megazygosporum TaxID=133381 RepID=A0A2T9ZFK2_9FUNG|nr:hypothetical protein BB560_002220 [Smittium megazygosporum]